MDQPHTDPALDKTSPTQTQLYTKPALHKTSPPQNQPYTEPALFRTSPTQTQPYTNPAPYRPSSTQNQPYTEPVPHRPNPTQNQPYTDPALHEQALHKPSTTDPAPRCPCIVPEYAWHLLTGRILHHVGLAEEPNNWELITASLLIKCLK